MRYTDPSGHNPDAKGLGDGIAGNSASVSGVSDTGHGAPGVSDPSFDSTNDGIDDDDNSYATNHIEEYTSEVTVEPLLSGGTKTTKTKISNGQSTTTVTFNFDTSSGPYYPVPIDPNTTKGAWATFFVGFGRYLDKRRRDNAGMNGIFVGPLDLSGAILNGILTLKQAEKGKQVIGVPKELLDPNATPYDKAMGLLTDFPE